ncbi:hypothetical protein Pan44_31290 [Caulifigura coniformis]|uniref:Uncharacterized protein n=1 Tax=Caulifigura coniformis TaxID=2527983 RepID=A0A517SG34_9PLAN|nr:hypothetical protein [Caulifigura coniformis]QDT55088.1 hypothetical protein Pan44_31290 [Caulifigura coniformis]
MSETAQTIHPRWLDPVAIILTALSVIYFGVIFTLRAYEYPITSGWFLLPAFAFSSMWIAVGIAVRRRMKSEDR